MMSLFRGKRNSLAMSMEDPLHSILTRLIAYVSVVITAGEMQLSASCEPTMTPSSFDVLHTNVPACTRS